MLSIEGETYSEHTLAIDDIDGEDNGGEYNSTTVTVSTDSDNYVGGDGNWNIGTATHNVKVALSKKGEQEYSEHLNRKSNLDQRLLFLFFLR